MYNKKMFYNLEKLAETYKKPREVIFSAFISLINYKKRRYEHLYGITIDSLFDTNRKIFFKYSTKLEQKTIKDLDKRYKQTRKW